MTLPPTVRLHLREFVLVLSPDVRVGGQGEAIDALSERFLARVSKECFGAVVPVGHAIAFVGSDDRLPHVVEKLGLRLDALAILASRRNLLDHQSQQLFFAEMETAELDEFLCAIDDGEITVVAAEADIAGVEPALGINHRLGGVWIVRRRA